MIKYVFNRLLFVIPTYLFVALSVFVLVRLVPGDPAQVILGEGASELQLARLHHELGLDVPIYNQFLTWAGRVLHGDLGRSIITGQNIAEMIFEHFQVTAVIVFSAVCLAALAAVPAGLFAAWRHNRWQDFSIVALAALLLSIPSFWLGLLFLLLFGLKLGWVPVVGYIGFGQDPIAAAQYVILPIVTLALCESGPIIRMMRASALEVMRLDYVTHARAKGLVESRVLLRHILPNAFAPTWTLIGLTLGHLLGGAAVLETVFTLPGLGRMMVDAVLARDYPVIQGCLLFTASIYLILNLIVDLCYPLFDPRILGSR